MEFETDYYSNHQTRALFAPYETAIDHNKPLNPPSTCNSGLQLGYLNLSVPQFCPVNPRLAGLIELGLNPDVLIKMEVQRSMSLLQVHGLVHVHFLVSRFNVNFPSLHFQASSLISLYMIFILHL